MDDHDLVVKPFEAYFMWLEDAPFLQTLISFNIESVCVVVLPWELSLAWFFLGWSPNRKMRPEPLHFIGTYYDSWFLWITPKKIKQDEWSDGVSPTCCFLLDSTTGFRWILLWISGFRKEMFGWERQSAKSQNVQFPLTFDRNGRFLDVIL